MNKDKLEILGIIPARGGSKSIPRKNIKPLLGKPLIVWTIEACRGSKLLTRFIVSTDDPEIAEISKKYGAEVPFLRPAEIAGDLSPSLDLMLQALGWFKENEKYQPDILVLLPPTAPLRQAEDIDRGIGVMLAPPESDSVRPVIESPKHPYKTLKIEGDFLAPFFLKDVTGFDEPYDLPRQLFPKAYIYSGAMQIMWRKTLTKQKSLTGKKSKYFLMRPEDSINIDSEIDFLMAELLMKQRFLKK